MVRQVASVVFFSTFFFVTQSQSVDVKTEQLKQKFLTSYKCLFNVKVTVYQDRLVNGIPTILESKIAHQHSRTSYKEYVQHQLEDKQKFAQQYPWINPMLPTLQALNELIKSIDDDQNFHKTVGSLIEECETIKQKSLSSKG